MFLKSLKKMWQNRGKRFLKLLKIGYLCGFVRYGSNPSAFTEKPTDFSGFFGFYTFRVFISYLGSRRIMCKSWGLSKKIG
jgi:hypothetical protein